jgi:hypothetical protein
VHAVADALGSSRRATQTHTPTISTSTFIFNALIRKDNVDCDDDNTPPHNAPLGNLEHNTPYQTNPHTHAVHTYTRHSHNRTCSQSGTHTRTTYTNIMQTQRKHNANTTQTQRKHSANTRRRSDFADSLKCKYTAFKRSRQSHLHVAIVRTPYW